MGRPADQFCKDNVEYLPKGKWRCKHCKEVFSGSATRIRSHLSGQGTEIRPCEAVPFHVREKASKKKRGLSSTSSSGEANLSTNKGNEQECITDAIVKFFVSRDIPIDALKDPHFTTLLMTAAQHGFPSCLLRGDSVGIQRSLSNLEHEVNQYMVMVKESWKTTGSTLICYNLKKGRGNPSTLNTDNVVYGFYCPQGFIFVQGPQIEDSNHLDDAFKNHLLNLPIEDVKHHIYHFGDQGCEFDQEFDAEFEGFSMFCVQQHIQKTWKKICTESGWVHNLIQKSEKLYDYMLNSHESYLCEGWRKVVAEQNADATPRSTFTRLRSIMHLENGLKAWLLRYPEYRVSSLGIASLQDIVNNNEFWSDGKELLQVLTPLLRIIDLVDTLVPTLGYLKFVVDNAKDNVKPYYDREVSKYQMIWDCVADLLPASAKVVVDYLSPIYNWRSIGWSLDLVLEILDEKDEEQKEKLDAELRAYRYNNPFAKLSSYERECSNHPVTLWKKYGGELPVLRKYAYKLLSQPASCMCNQVKKHITQCQGADNFILRLNYQMMQQFIKLGDRIYEPLGREFLEVSNNTHLKRPQVISPLAPMSPPTPAISTSPKSDVYKPSFDNDVLEEMFEWVPGAMGGPLLKEMVDGPHIGQIPVWMNEFIIGSIDVVADGNCGYRAIAESFGLGQDKWREVRQQLHDELKSESQLYEPTFVHGNVGTILKALSYSESGFAPPETWLEATDMGLLVATTFKAKFVVMGSTICCTYLPLYLPEGCQFYDVPEIIVCLGPSHFSSLSLTYNAPLPPVSNMWLPNRRPSTQDFDRFLSNRCASYNKEATRYSQRKEPYPIDITST